MNSTNRVTRSIQDTQSKGLVNLENNYLRLGKTEGGKYSLIEVRRELARRQGGVFDGETVYSQIMALAKKSTSGLVTYIDLYTALHKIPWVGHKAQYQIKCDLGAVFHYCASNNLPIATTIVVPKNTMTLTEKAKQNIYDYAKHLGVKNMSAKVETFVSEQQAMSLAMVKH